VIQLKWNTKTEFNKLMFLINTKNIFLIDGLGAIITAFILIVVLRKYETYFGVPAQLLVILSILPIVLAGYSFTCILFIAKISPRFLLPIIIANSTYCILTIGLIGYNFNRLTFLGITYFIIEILILFGLIYIEFKILKNKNLELSIKEIKANAIH